MPPDNLNHPLEDRLRRSLMPVSLSDDATTSIHSLLDELAAASTETPAQPQPWLGRLARSPQAKAITAAAAAITLLAAAASLLIPQTTEPLTGQATEQVEADDASAMWLVDETTQLSWVEDGGWLDSPDGDTLQAVRIGVVEENRLLDEETGIIVNVTSPREEMLLMPVSTF